MYMKKIIISIALILLLCGCARISEEPVTQADVQYSETEITEETTAAAEEETTEQETAAEPQPLYSADFFALFNGSDPITGRIADDMDGAVGTLAAGVSVAELSEESIKEITQNGSLAGQLFRFSTESSGGILTAASDDGDMNAFSFTDSEDTEYIVLLGSTDTTTAAAADKYISTCTRVDYLGYCAERNGSYVLMPVAAGNAESGIYGVIPNALLMGFDMSDTEEFAGIPDSISIRTAGAEKRDGGIFRLFCRLDSRFDRDVYYVFTNMFLNGENITDKITEDTSFRLEGAESVDLADIEIKDGDVLYFLGSVYESETDDLICDTPLAVEAKGIMEIMPVSDETEEPTDEENSEDNGDEE